ncbi:hypothetical protein HPP92_024603 [Vanilla planifolia]|uniref:Uncharacterized protein n=1 Tax=Vanilla planifolia TaxID=51239 RepID=A0A835PMN9_VANPL|nr:hypothetical protein HPP92_024603 [Vanilla planifolia]
MLLRPRCRGRSTPSFLTKPSACTKEAERAPSPQSSPVSLPQKKSFRFKGEGQRAIQQKNLCEASERERVRER